jgi:hypothetical protein
MMAKARVTKNNWLYLLKALSGNCSLSKSISLWPGNTHDIFTHGCIISSRCRFMSSILILSYGGRSQDCSECRKGHGKYGSRWMIENYWTVEIEWESCLCIPTDESNMSRVALSYLKMPRLQVEKCLLLLSPFLLFSLIIENTLIRPSSTDKQVLCFCRSFPSWYEECLLLLSNFFSLPLSSANYTILRLFLDDQSPQGIKVEDEIPQFM